MEEIKIRSLRDSQKDKMQKAEDFFEKKSDEDRLPAPATSSKSKRNIPKTIVKFIIFSAFIFALGGIGGIWMDRIFLPTLLVKYPELNQYAYLRQVNDRTTIVRETQEVHISEEEAISETIDKVSPSIVQILIKNANGQFEKVGAGIILTSDGYIITPLENIIVNNSPSKDIQVKLKNDKTYSAELTAQSPDYSLAILKISENNLPVIPYVNSEDLKLGQKLIVINDAVTTDIISKFIDDYKMPGSTNSNLQKRIQIMQNLDKSFAGSAIIGIDGKLVGVEQGSNIVIPLDEIKSFIDTSTSGNK